jgi:flagellar basal-body rod protein FlgC
MKIGTFRTIDISQSGLKAEHKRLQAVAENLANRETTKTENGSYYRPKKVIASEVKPQGQIGKSPEDRLTITDPAHLSKPAMKSTEYEPGGVKTDIEESDSPPVRIYDPSHPHSDEEGYVSYPDIDLASEMAQSIAAVRAYEANASVINSAKYLFRKAIEI